MLLRLARNDTETKTQVNQNSVYYFSGYFLYHKRLYSGKEAQNWLKDKLNNLSEFELLVEQMNGAFALIVTINSKVLICTDRYGFYPLYQIKKTDEITVSDNWEELLQYSSKKYDKTALYEMAGLGYIMGSKTLLEDITEVSPHSITKLYYEGSKLVVKENSYWEFKYLENSQKIMLQDFTDIWNEVVEDFSTSFSKNRFTLYIPLSGGLDSRLLAFSFSENKIPFYSMTYASSDNDKDIIIAKKVSTAAGEQCISHESYILDQRFLNELTKEPRHSDRITCALFTEKNSFYHKKVEDRADIFVPGHSGDFIAGSHLNSKMRSWSSLSDITEHIIHHKSSINSILRKSLPEYRDILNHEITKNLATHLDLIPTFMKWNIENRQRRYIVRSALYKGNPRMLPVFPFFDYRLVDLFSRLRLEDVLNMKYYIQAQKRHLYKGKKNWENLFRGDVKHSFFGNKILTEYVRKFYQKLNKRESFWHDNIKWSELPNWEYLPHELSGIFKTEGLLATNYQYLYSICKFSEAISNV